jgi:DNA adenine methylase
LSVQTNRYRENRNEPVRATLPERRRAVDELRAPFPWFGGKRRVAELVWSRLGNVPTYNEPFAGSLAVLLGRPHEPRVETVNDLDCYLANFWRALQHDPEAVAYHADGPVNEADLHARHRWLVDNRPEAVMTDPNFFDAQIAGWWVWGQCLWIGSGWCALTDKRNQHPSEQRKKQRGGDVGVHSRKRFASVGNGQGAGVHRRWQGGGKGGGSGVIAPSLTRQMPRISAEGGSISGVTASTLTRKKPQFDRGRRGYGGLAIEDEFGTPESVGLYEYLFRLAERLRRVRVCCGDWKRVLTPSVTTYVGLCGVFLDPPYAHDMRERCYAEDHDISADVRQWAIGERRQRELSDRALRLRRRARHAGIVGMRVMESPRRLQPE